MLSMPQPIGEHATVSVWLVSLMSEANVGARSAGDAGVA